MARLIVVFSLGFFLGSFGCSVYGIERVIDDKSQYEFAEQLFATKDYSRAILEYKRLEYYFPDSLLIGSAKIKIGLAYYELGPSKDGLDYLKNQIELEKNPAIRSELLYVLSLSQLDYQSGLPFPLREQSVQEAFSNLNALSDNYRTINWSERKIPGQKNPVLAGVLSALIPGSGSLYARRFQEGVYSFAVVAIFGIAAYDTKDKSSNNHNIHQLLSFLTLTFYAGSIYTAVNSTHIYNSDLENQYLVKVRDEYNLWLTK